MTSINFLRFFSSVLLVGIMAGFSGCAGYHQGSLMHPQIQTVALGNIVNKTDEPRLASLTRSLLAEQFQKDGSLRLVSRAKADCIVNVQITDYRLRSLGQTQSSSSDTDQQQYRTNIYGVDVELSFQTLIPGRVRPLIPAQTVIGHAEFTEQTDLDVVRRDGFKQAVYQACAKVVAGIVEAW